MRKALLEELAREAPVPARPAEAPAGPPLGQVADPEALRLARKVAAWSGVAPALPPKLGGWKATLDRAGYLARTPARLGVGRAGQRCRTGTVLDFQADHAAARDAVASRVDPEVVKALGLVVLRSAAKDRREFLVRPDLGRVLGEESRALVQQKGLRSPGVQIVAVDGLSATALTANLPVLLPPLVAALKAGGAVVGTPFLVEDGRVAAGDEVARLTGADLLCVLVGERPGLKTDRSLGAYLTWMKVRRFDEAMRSVVSNIHDGGTPPAEAAGLVAGLCLRALREKKTGMGIG